VGVHSALKGDDEENWQNSKGGEFYPLKAVDRSSRLKLRA